MEDLFKTLGEILKPENSETIKMRSDLREIESKIDSLEIKQNGGYTAQVAKSFHLGMVGGSGKNTARLNRIRGNELDKTIERAGILCALYKKRDNLKASIEYIESGKRERDAAKKLNNNELRAQYWRNLKVGDKLIIGGNDEPIITKKNAKSCETGSGCKWTAAEIIGKKAAELL
jgi:hypothetical protein